MPLDNRLTVTLKRGTTLTLGKRGNWLMARDCATGNVYVVDGFGSSGNTGDLFCAVESLQDSPIDSTVTAIEVEEMPLQLCHTHPEECMRLRFRITHARPHTVECSAMLALWHPCSIEPTEVQRKSAEHGLIESIKGMRGKPPSWHFDTGVRSPPKVVQKSAEHGLIESIKGGGDFPVYAQTMHRKLTRHGVRLVEYADRIGILVLSCDNFSYRFPPTLSRADVLKMRTLIAAALKGTLFRSCVGDRGTLVAQLFKPVWGMMAEVSDARLLNVRTAITKPLAECTVMPQIRVLLKQVKAGLMERLREQGDLARVLSKINTVFPALWNNSSGTTAVPATVAYISLDDYNVIRDSCSTWQAALLGRTVFHVMRLYRMLVLPMLHDECVDRLMDRALKRRRDDDAAPRRPKMPEIIRAARENAHKNKALAHAMVVMTMVLSSEAYERSMEKLARKMQAQLRGHLSAAPDAVALAGCLRLIDCRVPVYQAFMRAVKAAQQGPYGYW